MSQSAEHKSLLGEVLGSLYAPVRAELDEVERLLEQQLVSRHAFVEEVSRHGFRLGGKRLRPALVLLSGKAVGEVKREHVVLAAAMEMIHTATLIHDDVLDDATLRRHLQTVNARWNNESAVLLGDFLLARAMSLAVSIDDLFAVRTIAEAARQMCEGELRQVACRGNYDLTEKEYLDIIADKTGALTACCCRLGAYFAGADGRVLEAMTRFGSQLGIAFQISDDVLDLLGEESIVGKSLGSDLAKQKATLPVIRLLGQVTSAQRGEVVALLANSTHNGRAALRPWLERFDVIGYARQRATDYARRACAELECLPSSPLRDAFEQLSQFVVNRQQ
jgi:octaprenyl-diphosphate synthase